MSEKIPMIYKAISKAMKEVGAVGKDATNTFDKYKYRSIEAVYNSLQPALYNNGVFFVPTVLESEETEVKTAAGKMNTRIYLKVQYDIYAEDGSSIRCVVH